MGPNELSREPWGKEKHRVFSIYKKVGNFPLGISVWEKRVPFVTSPILGRPGDKDNKSVNGAQIFHWEVSTGKTGLPFQEFRLFRKISSGTNQKVVFHLQPDRNFRNFLVNGKRSYSHKRKSESIVSIRMSFLKVILRRDQPLAYGRLG